MSPAKSRDDWRVCIGFGDLPRSLDSFRQALILHLESRLGDQVAVGSSATQIFVYAPSAGLADEAAQVARELLAWRDLSAPVRTDFWSLREWKWRDRRDDPSYDPAAHRNADRQEAERKRSVMTGVPAWQVRVEVPSHRDVVALAGHLGAQGWRVRRRPRSLIVSANCEDDAKSLGRALSGDSRQITTLHWPWPLRPEANARSGLSPLLLRLTCSALSVGVFRRPLVSAVVVTPSVTHPVR